MITHRRRIAVPLLLCLVLPTGVVTAQTAQELLRPLHEANLHNAKRHAAELALINLNLEAHTTKDWDGVITKAGESIAIEPSSVAFSIRAGAWLKKGDLTAALADATRAIETGHKETVELESVNQRTEGGFEKQVRENKAHIADLYVRRSDLYVQLADRTKAEADLKAALAVDPADPAAKHRLHHLDKNIAEKILEQRLAHPRSAADHVFAGKHYLQKYKEKEALAAFDRALALDPKNVEAHIGRGDAVQFLQPGPAALADYDRAIKLDPDAIAAYIGKGRAHLGNKDWMNAAGNFSIAMNLGPATASLLASRGNAYLGWGRTKEALADFEASLKALATDDKYGRITALVGRADAYRLLNKPTEALAAYQQAIDASQGDHFSKLFGLQAYTGRGKIHAAQGRKEQAAADFKAVLALSANDPEAKAELAKIENNVPTLEGKTAEEWSTLGRQQVNKRAYADAVSSFNKSIELAPQTAFYHSLRGYAHNALGNEAGFKADFDRAIALAPKDVMVWFLRGTVLQNKGRTAEAIADFRQVLAIDPNHAGAKKKLQDLGTP